MPPTKDGTPEKHQRYSIGRLLSIGLLFHLIFIGSVFDCYFTSPVVNGMDSFSLKEPEAKRLVLIVGDGLRADLLFNENPFPKIPDSPKHVAPYLRSVMETRGAFGISHTRVPTESRPGHVALIGGMYEDVSAVTKGWKTNPVDFDSVFNQSSTTFSFGSPDILPMFTHGAVPGRVLEWSYDAHEEDFTKDAVELDRWVLHQLETLFRNATTDSILDSRLRADKVVIFLHLLGLDTTGHSYRPHSKEYMENIQAVDEIVKRTEELMKEFYKDEETSFIFTADHGMSVIGNHGDGHPDCTRTPLVAWGKGIRGPLPDSTPSSHDSYSKPWGLTHLYRRDVEQADIAALMSALIGVSWPVNSVGVLPDVDPDRPGYLQPKLGEETLAEAALVNAKMMLEQYRVKHELKKTHTLFYKPYSPLESGPFPQRIYKLTHLQHLINTSEWKEARRASQNLIDESLGGLHYLQTYDRTLLRTVVTFAYLGWMLYASLYIIRPLDRPAHRNNINRLVHAAKYVPTVTAALCWGMFLVQRSPWSYYLYVAFPAYFWSQFLRQGLPYIWSGVVMKGGFGGTWKGVKDNATYVIFALATLLILAMGYTQRTIWTYGTLFMASNRLLGFSGKSNTDNPRSVSGFLTLWYIACGLCSLFPLFPVDREEDLFFIVSGGLAFAFVGWYFAPVVLKEIKDKEARNRMKSLFRIQILIITAITVTTVYSAISLRNKQGLSLPAQLLNWIFLVFSSSLPYVVRDSNHTAATKLLMYFLGFGPCFVVLSISVEGLFFVAYSTVLVCWVISEKMMDSPRIIDHQGLEKEGANSRKSPAAQDRVGGEGYVFRIGDVRIALVFLFLIHLGFFGIGNVASISSFYLAPVYRLIPVFNPFSMSCLLLYKLLAPYVMLSNVLALLNRVLHLPPFSLLLVALSMIDVMTLIFFYRVRDTGSWLEIGESITFFFITSLLILFSAGLSVLGEWLMKDVLDMSYDFGKGMLHGRQMESEKIGGSGGNGNVVNGRDANSEYHQVDVGCGAEWARAQS